MSEKYRTFLSLCRTLHIYLTLLALMTILFFSVTGFMLNHESWFSEGKGSSRTDTITLPKELTAQADKFSVVEYLRSHAGARGIVSQYDSDEQEIRVTFKAPGQRTDILISREDGKTELTAEYRGIVAMMSDLHRAKGTGIAWRLILDGTAILLFIASLTGLLLFLALPKRRFIGSIALGTGIVLCAIVYFLMMA